MTNVDSILKSRDITLSIKSILVNNSQGYCFSSSHVGCENWTIMKAEHRRIDAFELWCWRKLLTVPWTARRSNQCILKEISPGCSLEGLMTQRDGMGREVEEGIRIGNMCTPMEDSC